MAVVLTAACAAPPTPLLVTREDSAGVEIVTSTPVGDAPAPLWRVSGRPSLEIGALDGPDEFTFGRIRSVGRLPDGRIYVGDEQAHMVRVFSESGDYLGYFGGEGDGPGELQWFMAVAPYRGDSIFVYDYRVRAVSVFGPDLAYGRRVANPIVAGNYWIVDALPDGRFLATSPGRSRFAGESGVFADSSHIVLLAADGRSADTVAAYPAKTEYLDARGRPQPSFLMPRGRAFVVGDGLAWVDGARFEIVLAGVSGEAYRLVRKAEQPVAVTSEHREAFRRAFLELTGQLPEAPPERIRRMLDEGYYPDFLPALSPTLHVDPAGYLWVSRYHHDGQPATRWEVFDSTGVWVGRVETPEGFVVHEVGESEIIGTARGEYDVPYVRIHRLRRE